jgi:hypothetical protein
MGTASDHICHKKVTHYPIVILLTREEMMYISSAEYKILYLLAKRPLMV